MKKILCLLFGTALFYSASFSQVDLGLPVSTGMGGAANGVVKDWECIGINPANLGWKDNYKFSIVPLVIGISVQSKALDYETLKEAITNPDKKFTAEEKQKYASWFTTEDGLNLQTNINWLAFSFHSPKAGGFALNLRDRAFGHVTLNDNAADILFNGKNAKIFSDTAAFTKFMSEVFDSTKISFMLYREMNLAYGRKLFGIGGTKDSSKISFYGGIGLKYLWGMGNFEMIAENKTLSGHSSFSSKFEINYGNIQGFSEETATGMFNAVGSGTALDAGLGVEVGKLRLTCSATDMGKITWNNNVLLAVDTLLPDTSKFTYSGIESWNVAQYANQMYNDSGLIEFKPGPAYSVALLSRFRLGAAYQFSKWITVAADMVFPISENPANLSSAYYALGTEIGLASNLKFSLGIAGNSQYRFSLPFGITLGRFAKIFEVRIATNDLLTYLDRGSDPNISLSISLFRFNLEERK